jgi:hypothetical protein
LEPPAGAPKKEAIELLYYQFRNPLAHAFGIQEKKAKGLTLSIGKGTSPEGDIEALERLTTTSLPTIAVLPASKTLIVESLYWGVREMLRRLTIDTKRMKAAEAYLQKVLV